MIRGLNKLGLSQSDKCNIQPTQSTSHPWEIFPLKSEMRKGCPFLLFLFNVVLKVLASGPVTVYLSLSILNFNHFLFN